MSDRVKMERQAMSPLKNEVEDQDDDVICEDGDDGDGTMDDEEGGLMMLSNSNSLDGTYDNGDYDDGMRIAGDQMGESSLNGILRHSRSGHGRANKLWTQPIEQAFLEKIKAFSCLYDHRDENWKNKKHKDGIWELIGGQIGIPASECRRHFKHMRDKFVRNKRTGKSQNTKFTRGMSFLVDLDLIKHRPRPMDDIHFLGTVSKSSSRNGSGRSSPVVDLQKNYASLLANSLAKRHYLDISNTADDDEDPDHEEGNYVLADTVMEPDPEPSPVSSMTITRSNGTGIGSSSAIPPPRRSLMSSVSAARTLATLMSATATKESLGKVNGNYGNGINGNGNGKPFSTGNGSFTGNGSYTGNNGSYIGNGFSIGNSYSTGNGMSVSNVNLSSNATHVIVSNGNYTVPRTINQTTISPAQPTATAILPKPSSAHTNGNSNTNGTSTKESSTGKETATGPNYFFGQYIASVLDSLPQAESLLTRHKLQEILFDAQSRLSTPSSQTQKHVIDFKCVNCCKIYQGSPQLP